MSNGAQRGAMSAKTLLFGYCDRISVRGGDEIKFMVSAEGVEEAEAQLVRMIHGDEHPDGPGCVEEPIPADFNGRQRVKRQFTQVGAFARVRDTDNRLGLQGPMTLYAYIWPTTPRHRRQVIMGRWNESSGAGYALGIDAEGHLEFRVGDGERTATVRSGIPLFGRCWYLVAASFDPGTRAISLVQEGMISAYNSHFSPALPYEYSTAVRGTCAVRPKSTANAAFVLAGCEASDAEGRKIVVALYNGKLDRCGVIARVLTEEEIRDLKAEVQRGARLPGSIAHWDPSAGYGPSGIGDVIEDLGPHGMHAEGYNRPIRALTGVNWEGRDDCYRLAPGQYGGVHFHEDAIIDCRWTPTFSWKVPLDLRSGCYAVKLTGGGAEEYIPFFVRPAAPRAPMALLIPTTSYLAYANERLSFSSPAVQPIFGRTPILGESDRVRLDHPELGLSTYDTHSDGGGVCLSSYRRPILNMRPKYRMALGSAWQYPADLSIVAWLEAKGYDYDVLCDEDLHREGVAALSAYRMVITGSHPEYYSGRMLDATEQYLERGGRLIYTGGNGYYWVSCYREEEPWCMEVRKLDSGSRAWQAMAGEHYNQTEPVRGGLWRNRGRAPQKLVGVGFATEGFDSSGAYTRLPDAADPRVSWIFNGVETDMFGGFGLALGGAAGLELDRYDLLLGTPPTAWLLATSFGYSDNYPRVSEEIYYNFPGQSATQDYQCRGDMVYFTTRNGGAVFSTGSIAWASALPCNAFENAVSTIMGNVVDAFLGRDVL